jgi:hypothetical protein
VHKAAQVDHLNKRLSVPLRITVNVFGNKDNVPFVYREPFIKINVGSLALQNDAEAGFAFIGITSAEVILIEDVT